MCANKIMGKLVNSWWKIKCNYGSQFEGISTQNSKLEKKELRIALITDSKLVYLFLMFRVILHNGTLTIGVGSTYAFNFHIIKYVIWMIRSLVDWWRHWNECMVKIRVFSFPSKMKGGFNWFFLIIYCWQEWYLCLWSQISETWGGRS